MKKYTILIMLLTIVLSACSANSSNHPGPTPSDTSQTTSPVESSPVSEISTPMPSDKSASMPEELTKQEILDFNLLRPDWTKEQMVELGLKEEVNEAGGETYFSNDTLKYIYFDARSAVKTPAIVDVFGDHPGPRGIHVGNTFEEVLSLFPQKESWKNNVNGVFYGNYDPDTLQNSWEQSGYVSVLDNGTKEITILTEDVYPFVRFFFKDDVLTNYSFFLISAQ